ncbi:hypothetical protein NC653_014299 [Populus alba x Populus x berolinensis]|uniref:Glycine-rich protein n=1 Tax=Populus alba x Populus x berolinensis TaxID=444605 RepID=A0AAD6QXL0_9ROSI|nr:hypothetical protein NC653_014299 [Populus alba x Populus x berolinensis]
MAKSAFSRPMAATMMTLLAATLLLMSSEVANATLNYDGAAALTLGLYIISSETTGRGGYNENPNGRGGYNEDPTGRGGYN